MRIRWRPTVIAATLFLACGCKPEAASPTAATSRMMVKVMREPGNTDQRIAFSHVFEVELPGGTVEATQQKNLTDCLNAGCTVLNTHIEWLRDGMVQASISVRIAPDRYQAFAAAVTASPATLVSHTESADDKTIPFMDIEKRLDAQTALRERLSLMLKQAGTNVADLVAVEKQLAEVQGTIESGIAERDYLRKITETVKVDVSYTGVIQRAGPFDLMAVRLALNNFVQILVQSVGAMIGFVAIALPWLPLVGLVVWILRWVLRRRRLEAGRQAGPARDPG